MKIMKNITFNELTTDNAFDFCAVLNAVGLSKVSVAFSKEELVAIKQNRANLRTVGVMMLVKVFNIVLQNISSAREEIYRFFANCAVWDNGGKVSVDELRTMKITDFLKMLKDFFNKDDIIRFLEEAAEIFNAAPGEESAATTPDSGDMTATVPAEAQ